ncbi:microtubule-associated protein 4 isoform X4 [Scophthalmus maximus]|uniref:microtubule-associated protein 4 isoform X4 n=1 Tax=Scophthalmus maximus TaxID=52904 RepID=UPI0015E0B5D9|nr:microtubule-associated protein 4 isoform X4 [Scophthalmus maximus]
MDLTLRDALGGGGGGVPGGAPAESLLKRDFMASLEKESYDDKVGETVSKSDYRPLLDGKDTKSGPGMMSSMMSSGGYQEPLGQPTFSSDSLSGFSQSGMGGIKGSSLPPFQTSMSSPFGQSGIGSATDTQKSPGLFGLGVENKTPSNTSGSSSFKTSDPFSSGGPGVHTMDFSAAPVLSPGGSNDDVSPTSSTSGESPERDGPGGEAGKQQQQQRRRKKRRKGRDEVYDFLDSQEKNASPSDKPGIDDRGVQEADDNEDEEENWEWEIRESGGGGRVKGRKTKSRARLPQEWGAPQQPVSPTLATIAPTWATPAHSDASDLKAPHTDPVPVLPPACAQIPTSFTNHSHACLVTDLSPRSYEPMCVDDFPMSATDTRQANEEKVSNSKPDDNVGKAASATATMSSLTGDVSGSLAIMTGDSLCPVSQTFSFLDSVLQTPQGTAPDSQTNTPSLATAPQTTTAPAFSVSKSSPVLTPAPALSTIPTAVGSALSVDAQPFVPAATPAAALSSASPSRNEAPPTLSSATPPTSVATRPSSAAQPPSITPAAPPTLPAHSEHQESSSPQLPPLEVKSDNKDKQEKMDIMSGKPEKIDAFDKKEEQQKKDNGTDKNQKSEKILKDEEKMEKLNAEKNKANEKAEKVDKPEKTNKDERKEEEKKLAEKKDEKGGKGTAKSSTGIGSKTLPSPDSKSKPDMGATKPNSTKPRPSTLSTNGEATSTKHSSPTPASANKKSPVTKATTPNAAKRLPMATASAKTPENSLSEKRPPAPRATPTPRAAANKNGSSPTAASKATVNKNDKTENKTGEAKKPKTTARPRPASTTTPATPAASTNGDANGAHRRRVITKPPVPKQVPLEKKPAVPRAHRTPRPINAPTPDLKNVRSKIGSIDNIKYQPGGGKVSSTPNNKTSDPCTPAAKARVQILSKKVDVSKVTSKCGSKDNIKYKPGGGDVKIESLKVNNKARSKIGSMDNVGPGNAQTNGHKEEKAEEKTSSPPSSAPATGPVGVAKATGPGGVAKENGAKEPTPTPFGGDGLREPLSIDKRITEKN